MKRDLSDIEKYKKGELTAAQMHELEKRALSDTFLAEALEGIQNLQEQELSADLTELDQRLKGKTKKTVWFTPLRIAAGVLIVISASYLVYTTFPNEEQTLSEAKPSAEEKSAAPADTLIKSGGAEKTDQLLALERPRTESKPQQAVPKGPVELQPLDESQAQGEEVMELQLDAIVSGGLAVKSPEKDTVTVSLEEGVGDLNVARREAEKEEAPVIALESKDKADEGALKNKARMMKRSAANDQVAGAGYSGQGRVLTGKVTSAEDGQPLPGVNVTVKGNADGTVTDIYGNYSVNVPVDNALLVFSFIGMQSMELSTQNMQTLNVQLNEDSSQVSEVVVTALAQEQRDDTQANSPVMQIASPVGGTESYNQYLEENLRYPQQARDNNVKGRVTIQFTVLANGDLASFKVVKGIGHGCDEELIRLIKDGPQWNPATRDSVPFQSEVKVKLKFDPDSSKK